MCVQEELKSGALSGSMTKLSDMKQATDNLLYGFLPRQVAEVMRSGGDPLTACKVCSNMRAANELSGADIRPSDGAVHARCRLRHHLCKHQTDECCELVE